MSKQLQSVRNFFFDTSAAGYKTTKQQLPNSPAARKNLAYTISPVQFVRIKHDIQLWREAVVEAENAYYPFRVRMQRMMQDTILNEHVEACWERRKDLTLLRDFKICDAKGKEAEDLKSIFQKTWFTNFISYALDALGFGFTLISLGDIVSDGFPDLTIIPRQNISPDRRNVSTFPNIIGGQSFDDPMYRPWHIWVPTNTKLGVSRCGYGLFYTIAKAEIYIRNNASFNADFQEVFGQPLRKGKTTKTEEDERAAFASQLANMGSNAWILLDEGTDDVELVESKQVGASYKSFADFEKRNEQKISKVILGHADAMDSTPGKLGGTQGAGTAPANPGGDSPVTSAMNDKQMKDGAFIEDIINGQLIPRMRDFGFKIPITHHFEFLNNGEEEELRKKEDESNQGTANIALALFQAGLNIDPDYFTERTGIPVKAVPPPPAPVMPGINPADGDGPKDPNKKPVKDPKLTEKQKNKLDLLYTNPRK